MQLFYSAFVIFKATKCIITDYHSITNCMTPMAIEFNQDERRDVLFSTRLTVSEAVRVDEILKQLNERIPENAPRVTRSSLTRTGLELVLAQADLHINSKQTEFSD